MAILNSLIVSGVSSGIAIVLGTLCAYSLARFGTGGENLTMWIISQRMIPPIAVVFPIFLIYVYFGLVDGYFGLILLYTAFNLPYVIWMMRGYIVDVPLELEESALVDGLNRWEVIWKVVCTTIRILETGDGSQQSALAAAGRPHQHSEFAVRDGEIPPDRMQVAVIFVYSGQLDVSHSALPNP